MSLIASNYPLKENNLYETEAWATQAALRHVPVAGRKIWEPAAGNHKIADELRAAGAFVMTSDIVIYDREHDRIFDFLSDGPIGDHPQDLFTNPPYGKQNRLAVKFAERALARCSGTVALLLTAKFDSGSTRAHLIGDNPRFRGKIVLVDRIQWFPGKTGGTEDHAWYIWGPETPFPPAPVIRYEGRAPA